MTAAAAGMLLLRGGPMDPLDRWLGGGLTVGWNLRHIGARRAPTAIP